MLYTRVQTFTHELKRIEYLWGNHGLTSCIDETLNRQFLKLLCLLKPSAKSEELEACETREVLHVHHGLSHTINHTVHFIRDVYKVLNGFLISSGQWIVKSTTRTHTAQCPHIHNELSFLLLDSELLIWNSFYFIVFGLIVTSTD